MGLVLAACSTSQPENPASFETRACWEHLADVDVRCGVATVPADWDDPAGDTISLAVTVLDATDAAARVDDPVIVMAGGPGGSATLSTNELRTAWADINRTRDIVMIDQRGTGFGEPFLGCDVEGLNDEKDAEMLLECRSDLVAAGAVLSNYTSAANARDFASVPLAMGYERWNLWGGSYGTRLGLTILRDNPDGVRSLILDSVFPPEVNGLTDGVFALGDALDAFVDRCAGQPACADAFPDLRADLGTFISRLEDELVPEALMMLTAAVAHPDAPGLVTLGASDSAPDVVLALGDAVDELAIAAAASSDDGADTSEDDTADGGSPPTQDGSTSPDDREFAVGMSLSVMCAEEFPQGMDARSIDLGFGEALDEAARRSGPAGAPVLPDLVAVICPDWGAATVDSEEFDPVAEFDRPTLFVGGTSDLQTPARWTRTTAARGTASSYIEVFGAGHVPTVDNECLIAAMGRFLDDPAAAVAGAAADCDPDVVYRTELPTIETSSVDDGPGDTTDGETVDKIVECLADLGVDLGVDAADSDAVIEALNSLDLDDPDVLDAVVECS